MPNFTFTDKEFLTAMDLLIKWDLPPGKEYIPLQSMDEQLDADRLDSLSMVIFFVWLTELFGIPESRLQDFISKGNMSIQAIKDFVTVEATKTYSYAEAEEYMKRCM